MPKMKVAIVPKAKADFELIERDVPTPGSGQVRIKVIGCGVCFSDHMVKDGLMPWISYPRSPGHEITGVIDEIGPHVTSLKKGQKVGVGWHGGHDFTCLQCRRGDFINCANEKWTGIHYDGGYAEYMIAPWEAVAAMPDGLDPIEAAPLLCAGITTFNALRHGGAIPGDLVAVLGVGGLGHLGIQFANKFGYQVVGISRGKQSEPLARKLGAHMYIDSSATNAAEELKKLGGARVILSTAPSGKAMASLVDGLGANGRMLVIGAGPDPIEVQTGTMIFGNKELKGWASGTAPDSEDTLRFAAYTGVRPMIEKYPLDKVNEAYNRMTSGKAQFRVVLTM
ncbi:MAG TPA: alcohol dehydrogenase [Candidatus Eisenbacteria bacterium]|jgi:D-arabinose 1-dehydrogenase-like Zn-dependent alcohol dehydrogenase|nr:alcohol dehydrogenase [Candidatus Eisenbacteria bacterium]